MKNYGPYVNLLLSIKNQAIRDELVYRKSSLSFHVSPWIEWKKSFCREVMLGFYYVFYVKNLKSSSEQKIWREK